MIKALWFMVKVGLLVVLAVAIANRPGFVEIELEWLGLYSRMHYGVFLVILLAVILLAIFIYRAIRLVVDSPKNFRRYRKNKRKEKGYRALTLGLTAVAAGDTKAAVRHARQATEFLEGDTGLPMLLQAQAARLDGREEDAQKSFVALLENKDAAFLGVRGLLQAALDTQDYERALDLAQRALKIHPRQPWILGVVYDLEIKQHAWEKARKTLGRAEKYGAVTAEKAKKDRVAMLLAEAEADVREGAREQALRKVKKARKVDADFVPASLWLAKLYNQTGKRRQAVSVVEKSWKANPHPEFAAIWDSLEPIAKRKAGKGKEPLSRLRWFEKLLAINPDVAAGQMTAGRIALEEKLWGEARSFLKRAEELEPSPELYRLFAELEERSANDEEAAVMWLEKAAELGPGRVWVCAETGRIYDEWHPVAQPHGAFNTIEWDFPYGTAAGAAVLTGGGGQKDAPLIEASKT